VGLTAAVLKAERTVLWDSEELKRSVVESWQPGM